MLSHKQQAFVEAYLQTWNASEAARRAGYRGAADVVGPRLLGNIGISAAIQARLANLKLSTDEGLTRLAEHARGSVGCFFKAAERWTDSPRKTDEILDEMDGVDPRGKTVRLYRVRYVVVDTDKLLDPHYAPLIQKLKDSPKDGLTIELYNAQEATVKLLDALGVFKRSGSPVGLIDYGKLAIAQLERIAAGEDPLTVLISGHDSSDSAGTS